MQTLLDRVVWHGKVIGDFEVQETCTVMTRRIRLLGWNRSRTTVLPAADCERTPGFIVWWNTHEPENLKKIHAAMVETITRIGFTNPAVWCDSRHKNRNPKSLNHFWCKELGEAFQFYRKAT